MTRVTVIPADRSIIVDGIAAVTTIGCDPNIHALQYDSTDDLLRFELKQGARDPVTGEEAAAIIKPFVDAHAMEVARIQAAEAAVAPKVVSEAVPGTQQF